MIDYYKKLERNIYKLYFLNFFKGLIFITPFFVLYFQESGINYFQVLMILSAQSFFQISFEVPSGIISDYYGRKVVLILASVFRILGALFYLGSNFFSFLCGGMFFGISIAFTSGSDTSLIFDSLRELKKENMFQEKHGNFFSLNQLAIGLASLLGSFIFAFGSYKATIFFTLLSFLISFFISISLKEPNTKRQSRDTKYFSHLKEAINYAKNHKKIKILFLFMMIVYGLIMISHRFFQPFLEDINISIKHFGIIYFIWLSISAFGASFASKIRKKIGEFNSILIIPIFLSLSFFSFFFFSNYIAFLLIILNQFCWGFTKPIIDSIVICSLESHNKATVLSLKGFMINVL